MSTLTIVLYFALSFLISFDIPRLGENTTGKFFWLSMAAIVAFIAGYNAFAHLLVPITIAVLVGVVAGALISLRKQGALKQDRNPGRDSI